jgi:hypothetical protein
MNVLDVDLDFFASNVLYENARLPSEKSAVIPWSIDRVDHFLRRHCGLGGKAPGLVVDQHRDVYYFVRDIKKHSVVTTRDPWIHVDSHSDLGFGTPVMEYLAHGDFSNSYGLSVNSNNFLLALLATGRIEELHCVYNKRSLPDYDPALFRRTSSGYAFGNQIGTPEISFHRYTEADFVWNRSVDFIFLTLSPEYTNEWFIDAANYIRTTFIQEVSFVGA